MKTEAFSFQIPGTVKFGAGILSKLPEELKNKNINKVLLTSDRQLEKIGLVEKLENLLAGAGIEYVEFLDIEANPSTETVERGTEIFRENGLDAVVCLGGGSPLDTSKAISVLLTNGGKIGEYEGANKVKGPVTPVVAIPTTAGTGSEVTPFIVITDRSKNYKMTIFSLEVIPELAVLDPELITTLPPLVAASTGLDALTHAVEAYISLAASPFSEAMSEKAMELIGQNIRSFVANRADIDAASDMLLGSMFAGVAFSWAKLGNVHAMAHPLGGFYDIAHGVANAVLLPVIMEYNALADKGKYKKIFDFIKDGKEINGFTPGVLVDELRQLLDELNIPKNLSELGVSEDTIPQMAEDAMKSGNILVNPRKSTQKDIEELYHRAM